MSTVLLRRSSLGDVVLVGSITARIQGSVVLMTDPRWMSLGARLKGVDRVLPWNAPLPPGRVVDLQGSLRSRWLRRGRPGGTIRKGSIRRRSRLWLGVGPRRASVPELYGRAAGVEPRPPPWIDLPERARDGLALVPGAAWAPKQWHVGRLGAVGRAWEGPVHVLGGPGEEALVAEVAAAVPGSVATCEAGFERTLDVLAGCAVAVAGDTGLMHLAGACGVAVVALFGPTHPDDGFFVYPRGSVVERDLPCRPCTLHRIEACPKGHHGCMDISVDEVWKAVRACAG